MPLSNREPSIAAWMRPAAAVAALLLLALRLPHLPGPIDDPHSWRQCDTAHYSLDFYRHGIDLLRPAVCWLGSHRTLIFEFPLPEALSALLYRAFGPDPIWDRVVSLAFFTVATIYLYAFVRRIAGARVAALAALAYLAFPLGRFFSRAAHVDFVATAFAHALLYHTTRAAQDRAPLHATLAGAAGALAAMIKAPYVLPVLGPLALVLATVPLLSALAIAAPSLGLTALAFVLWRRHVDHVNATAPDWSFLPGYYKEVNPGWWYYGELSQRLVPANWIKLARRLVFEVAAPAGTVLSALALTRGPAPATGLRVGPRGFALAWSAGVALYLFVFFPLNVIHDYYQIPFLAPAALLVGLGGDRLWGWLAGVGAAPLGAAAFALFLVLAVAFARPAGYYRVDWLRIEAGRRIDARVPAGDLVVASDFGSGYSDPRLLFRSDREGWSVAIPDLTPDRIARLERLGARWAAVVTDLDHPVLRAPAWLDPARVAEDSLAHDGRALGAISLFDLARLPASTGGTR